MISRRSNMLLKLAVLCLSLAGYITADARQASWTTKNVSLECKDCSMPQALDKLAAQAGISILAEGEPATKPFTLREYGNAGEMLTHIADAYDYEWHVAKSGIVLMSKRFTDEHEAPEINPAEMQASVQDVLTILHTIYTPPPPRTSLLDAARQFVANLSEEEAGRLKSPRGLSISTLSPALQSQAANVIYFNEFMTIYSQMDYFAQAMRLLPTSSVTSTSDIKFSNGDVSKYVELTFGHPEALDESVLWNRYDKVEARPVGDQLGELASSGTTPPAAFHLQSAFTVARLFAVLHDRFQITATITPKMQDKRIVLLLQAADAKRVLPALGELENWVVQQKEGQANAFLLYRHSITLPNSVREMRQPVLQAFPPDVARCFYTRPKTLGDKVYEDMHDLFPQLPGAGDPQPFASAKMRQQKDAASAKLRRDFDKETFAAPIPYSRLSDAQKRGVVQILFNQMGYQVAGGLWKFLYRPNSYVTDPANARMILVGNSLIVIGATGGRFQATEGVPIK